MNVRWVDANSGVGRCGLVLVIVLVWQVRDLFTMHVYSNSIRAQIVELNTFFIKHIFAIDTSHPLVVGRILLIAVVGAPTIRQYYM
jgi:phosphatidylserine synthase 1